MQAAFTAARLRQSLKQLQGTAQPSEVVVCACAAAEPAQSLLKGAQALQEAGTAPEVAKKQGAQPASAPVTSSEVRAYLKLHAGAAEHAYEDYLAKAAGSICFGCMITQLHFCH